MKVVSFGWGLACLCLFFACGGQVAEKDGAMGSAGSAGTGGMSKPVACPSDKSMASVSKLAGKACSKLYDACGMPGSCQYGCLCLDLGSGLQWTCGNPCTE